jgi:ketosteroid isomerase-like protein
MHLKPLFMAAITVAVVVLPARAESTETGGLSDELMRHAQELFDAVTAGNADVWKKYFADDCLFFDEKGRNMTKAELVADIQPLPKGYSGTIKVGKAKSLIQGDTAILSYDVDETETVFGQNLTARYHVTDTWLHRNDVWQIAASQVFRYYEDPAVGKIDMKKLPDFAGTYELAPGQTRKVFVEGDKLFVERKGKKEQLFPEASEIFFRKGVEGRILFRYADNSKVDALIDRRNNEDIVWRKIE